MTTHELVSLNLKFDEGKSVYEGAFVEEDLRKFIHSNQLPLVVEFNQEVAFEPSFLSQFIISRGLQNNIRSS